MSLFLRLHLRRLAKQAEPSKVFLNRLETRLFERKEIVLWHRSHLLRFAVVPALLIVTLLGGTGAYAYTSDQVLPDHVLYPLRKSIEGFQVQIAAVTPMKDRVRLRLLERHAREKRLLEEKQAKEKASAKTTKSSTVKVVPVKNAPVKMNPVAPTSTKSFPQKASVKKGS
jgi:hypothetical protein